jgi:DNA-directed RNA polymerase subunit M/transcription elongation factor TFIIS
MRPAEGKEFCYLCDHVGNANRYGWFADIFHETLDTTPPHVKGSAYEQTEEAPREIKRKQCSICRSYLPRGAFKCPTCGNVMVVDDTVTIDSELVDLRKVKAEKKAKRELAEKEKAERAEKKKKGEPQAFYSGLLDFAERRGFKEGWAWYKYVEKYGQPPTGLNKVPMTPRKVVKEFIKESGRKWQQEKKAESIA